MLPETDQGCIGPGSHRRCLRLPTGSYKHGHAPAKAPARQEKTAAALERGGARAPRASSRVRFRSQAPIAPDRCPLGAQVRRRSSAPRHPVRLRAPAAAVRRHVAARSRALHAHLAARGAKTSRRAGVAAGALAAVVRRAGQWPAVVAGSRAGWVGPQACAVRGSLFKKNDTKLE